MARRNSEQLSDRSFASNSRGVYGRARTSIDLGSAMRLSALEQSSSSSTTAHLSLNSRSLPTSEASPLSPLSPTTPRRPSQQREGSGSGIDSQLWEAIASLKQETTKLKDDLYVEFDLVKDAKADFDKIQRIADDKWHKQEETNATITERLRRLESAIFEVTSYLRKSSRKLQRMNSTDTASSDKLEFPKVFEFSEASHAAESKAMSKLDYSTREIGAKTTADMMVTASSNGTSRNGMIEIVDITSKPMNDVIEEAAHVAKAIETQGIEEIKSYISGEQQTQLGASATSNNSDENVEPMQECLSQGVLPGSATENVRLDPELDKEEPTPPPVVESTRCALKAPPLPKEVISTKSSMKVTSAPNSTEAVDVPSGPGMQGSSETNFGAQNSSERALGACTKNSPSSAGGCTKSSQMSLTFSPSSVGGCTTSSQMSPTVKHARFFESAPPPISDTSDQKESKDKRNVVTRSKSTVSQRSLARSKSTISKASKVEGEWNDDSSSDGESSSSTEEFNDDTNVFSVIAMQRKSDAAILIQRFWKLARRSINPIFEAAMEMQRRRVPSLPAILVKGGSSTKSKRKCNTLPWNHKYVDLSEKTASQPQMIAARASNRSAPNTGATSENKLSSKQIRTLAAHAADSKNGKQALNSAIHDAAKEGNGELCLILLLTATYRMANYKDAVGRTALHMGARYNLPKLCQALLEHELFELADAVQWGGWTALHLAARQGHAEPVKVILNSPKFHMVNAKDDDGRTVLHCAAISGVQEVVKAILKNPNFTLADDLNHGGYSALHIAERHGHKDVCDMVAEHLKESSRMFVRPTAVISRERTQPRGMNSRQGVPNSFRDLESPPSSPISKQR